MDDKLLQAITQFIGWYECEAHCSETFTTDVEFIYGVGKHEFRSGRYLAELHIHNGIIDDCRIHDQGLVLPVLGPKSSSTWSSL